MKRKVINVYIQQWSTKQNILKMLRSVNIQPTTIKYIYNLYISPYKQQKTSLFSHFVKKIAWLSLKAVYE